VNCLLDTWVVMSISLQDQLLGAGLVDKKKAKNISKQKKKQKNVDRRSKEENVSEAQQLAQKTRDDKLAKDRELNQQRKAEADRKAIAAQIIQLINLNKLDRRGDVEFNFSDGKAIKKIHVSQKISDEVSRGRLCIARLGESYEVVPKPVADKIRERDDETVVVYNQSSAVSNAAAQTETSADDDHYAQFEIPDDLMW